MKLYSYVGPAEILARVAQSPSGTAIESPSDLAAWLQRSGASQGDGVVTFIVNEGGVLTIADRRSEHVACARGKPVLSAGEMTFSMFESPVSVITATNQSTGYCPEPSSWPVVAAALEAAGIDHPVDFTTKFEFRRCTNCGQINLLKDHWFQCEVCESKLPEEWNFDAIGHQQDVQRSEE